MEVGFVCLEYDNLPNIDRTKIGSYCGRLSLRYRKKGEDFKTSTVNQRRR